MVGGGGSAIRVVPHRGAPRPRLLLRGRVSEGDPHQIILGGDKKIMRTLLQQFLQKKSGPADSIPSNE